MWTLYLNFILYFFTFVYYQRKEGFFSIRVFVLLLYCIFSVSGIVTLQTGIYNNMFGSFNLNNLSLVPYLCNYVLVLYLIYSIPRINFSSLPENKILQSKFIFYSESFFIVLSIVFLALQYLWYQTFSDVALADIYERGYTGEEDKYVFSSTILRVIYYRSNALLTYAVPFFYLIEFAKMAMGYNYKKPLIIVLLMFIPQVLIGYFSASRGTIVFQIANLFFFVVYFWYYIPVKVRTIITTSLMSLGVLIISLILAISLSRAGENSVESQNEIYRYFGEAFPNLGLRVWDVDGIHLYGMRKFPEIYGQFAEIPKSIVSYNNPNLFFEAYSSFPIQNFKTLYGDLYCEWGAVLPFVIVVAYVRIALFLQGYLRNTLFSLIIQFCIYRILVYGLFNADISQTSVISLFSLFVIAKYLNSKTVN